jgi:hypothetical protein
VAVAMAVERTAVVVAASTTAVVAAKRVGKKKKVLSVEVLKPKIGTSTDRQTSELIKRI